MKTLAFAVLLVAVPGLALAQAPAPGTERTPGPTASPSVGDPGSFMTRGTANILQPDNQGEPLAPGAPPQATPPSGAPPDVVMVPK